MLAVTTVINILEGIGGIVGLGALISAVIIYGRVTGLQASVSLFSQANTELRAANEAGQSERASLRHEFTDKLHAQELECERKIAHLEGQVSALTDGLADKIVTAVTTALHNQRT